MAMSSVGSPSGGARGVGAHEVDRRSASRPPCRGPGERHAPPRRHRATGERDVMGVRGRAVAEHLGVDPRARARACPSSSSTSVAAPSATTNPSRPASNGRLAPAGSSLRVDRARIAANAADGRLVDGRLAAARQHDLGVAAQDHLGGLADGVAGRRAGARRREVGAHRAEGDRRLARGHVGDGHRDEERAEAVRPARRPTCRSGR